MHSEPRPHDAETGMAADDRLAYRVDDLPAICGIGRTSLYDLIKSGALKSVKKAGRRLVLREDLVAYLRSEAA